MKKLNYSGCYMSILDFIDQNKLEKESTKLFGILDVDWEPENDIEQIQELVDDIDEDGYVVKEIKITCKRDERADEWIDVFKVID